MWQGRHPSMWFWPSVARCLAIAAFTYLCPGNSTSCFLSARTSAWDLLISYCVSSIAVCEHPALAILEIFKARRRLDYSSCTWPPCLTIVVDMLKTYTNLAAASNNEIQQPPTLYTLPQPPLRWLKPVTSPLRDADHEICARKWHSLQLPDVPLHRLCRPMRKSTREDSHYRQRCIGHVGLYIYLQYDILSVDSHLPWYEYTQIHLHGALYSCWFQSCRRLLNVHRGLYFWWLHWQPCC